MGSVVFNPHFNKQSLPLSQPPPKRNDKFRRNSGSKPVARAATAVVLRKSPDEKGWEFLHPRCALDRRDDLEEVQTMVAEGEHEIAVDELRWLLNGCPDYIDAHRQLGELALLDQDFHLARAHFGYAVQIGTKAWEKAGKPTPIRYALPANQAFFESGKGLAFCLKKLEKLDLLGDVVEMLVKLDPTDPLGVRRLVGEDGR